MKFKAYTGITWSNLELAELLNDEDSGVYYEKIRKHFGLHPFHLTNLHAALNEILSSNLNSYDPELKGFLLAYKNPKLLTSLGETLYDTCFIHIDIEADFYIFRPEVGASLKGIVNKKGLSHIGVLVHKAFNVSIPKSDGEDDWPGDTVNIGHEVRFNVTYLDFTSRLPFIRGSLDKDDYLRGCKLPAVFDRVKNRKVSFSQASDDGEDTLKKGLKFENTPRPFFTSDSESSSDEKIQITAKEYAQEEKNVKLTASPESNVHNDSKKKRKNSKRKSKSTDAAHENQKSEESELSQEAVDHEASMNGDVNNDDLLSETKVETHRSKKSKKHKLASNKTDENSYTELDESSRTKTAESFKVETNKAPKVKNERIRTISSSSTVIEVELDSSKIKSEKVSKSQNRSDNRIEDSRSSEITPNTQSTKKRSVKRVKSLDLEGTSSVNIKQEESIPVNNTTNSQTIGTDDDNTQSRIKKKNKKRRRSTEIKDDVHENDIGPSNTSTPIIKIEKPDFTIAEPTSGIPAINIKTEKLLSDNEKTSSKSSKKRKSKQSEQLVESESYASSSETKLGKTTQSSSFRNNIENDNDMQEFDASERKSVSEKHSPRKGKTRLKNTMASESENDSFIINVKQEESIETNCVPNTENQGENGSSLRNKKKSKKQKLSTSVSADDGNNSMNQLADISTEQQVNSTVFDSSAELPVVRIKQEVEHSDYESCQNEVNVKSNILLRNASSVNETMNNVDDLEENSIKKKKKKRKHDTDIIDKIKFEPTSQITIKTEDSDSNSRNKYNSPNKSGISPSKKKHTGELEDSTSDGQQSVKKRKHSKNLINENLQINIKQDSVNEEESTQDEQKLSKKSPHKRSNKSKIKIESAFDNGNIEIKIEQ